MNQSTNQRGLRQTVTTAKRAALKLQRRLIEVKKDIQLKIKSFAIKN